MKEEIDTNDEGRAYLLDFPRGEKDKLGSGECIPANTKDDSWIIQYIWEPWEIGFSKESLLMHLEWLEEHHGDDFALEIVVHRKSSLARKLP